MGCPKEGPPSPEVTGAICRVPSTPFSQAPEYALPTHLCRFRVRSICRGCFLEALAPHPQSIQGIRPLAFVTSGRLGTINPIPIGYGSRPHLRGRLTLRGLTLRRNPWACGDSVSHAVSRYSCQHSHFRYLHHPSQGGFTGLRNAPLPRRRTDDRRRYQTTDVGGQMTDPYLSSVFLHPTSVVRRLSSVPRHPRLRWMA
jgi:hypothetical protein